jgi:hypothetical protein
MKTRVQANLSPLFKIALVLVRLDHVARRIVKRESEHRGDGKRFVLRADEMLSAFLELQRAIQQFAVSLIS